MNAVNAGAEAANRFLPHISQALNFTNKWSLAHNTLTRVVRLWRSQDNRSFHQNKPDNITAIGATDDKIKINNKLGGDPGGTRG